MEPFPHDGIVIKQEEDAEKAYFCDKHVYRNCEVGEIVSPTKCVMHKYEVHQTDRDKVEICRKYLHTLEDKITELELDTEYPDALTKVADFKRRLDELRHHPHSEHSKIDKQQLNQLMKDALVFVHGFTGCDIWVCLEWHFFNLVSHLDELEEERIRDKEIIEAPENAYGNVNRKKVRDMILR